MRSFLTTIVAATVALNGVVEGEVVVRVPDPIITPAPSIEDVFRRQDPDAASLAEVLLTAVPDWLREIAATNLPAASSIINSEFFDGQRPWWFTELPWDIQSYLISKFGPATAIPNPTENPSYASETATVGATTQTAETSASPSQPTETGGTQPSSSATSDASGNTYSSGASQTTSVTHSVHSTRSVSSLASVSLGTSGAQPTDPAAPISSDHSGLTRSQKIGIGVGVPLALLAVAACAFACCFLLRRRRKRHVAGSVPPSSPGFIPRFAFEEKVATDREQHHPLNHSHSSTSTFSDLHSMAWDEDVVAPATAPAMHQEYESSSSGESIPTLNHHPEPVMAPALFHTHSSNRARGKRTSYTSLHSVAEVTEPDENEELESPVLGRRQSSLHRSPKRLSPPRSLIPPPAIPAASKIRRKPVPSNSSPAAQLASDSLLRQTMPDHKPATAMATFGNTTRITAGPSPYVSPMEENDPNNPFSNRYHYEEDYGPEYHSNHAPLAAHNNNSYVDVEDGLYGGHTSLSRYPAPKPSSRTEWPLRNFSMGNSHRRNKSPLWDRVYEG